MIPEDFLLPDDDPTDREREREAHIARIIARVAEDAGLVRPTDQFSFEWHTMFDAEVEAMSAQSEGTDVRAGESTTGESGSADLGVDFNLSFGGDFGAF